MNKIRVLAVAAVLGLLSLGGVSAASAGSAQTGSVAVDLPNEAVKGGTSAVVPVTLSEFSFTDLSVRLVPGSGTLTLANPGQLTLNPGYPSFEAQQSISFHGALADVVSALQTNLSWTAPGDAESSSLLTIRVEVTKFVSGTTYDPLTGHTYMFIESPLPWHDALIAAKGMTYQGLTGYLATITSQAENDFIGTKLGAEWVWFGATDDQGYVNEARAGLALAPITFDSQLTGDFYWAGGPEIGVQFSVGLGDVTPINGLYNNWVVGEPNNANRSEGCAVTNWISVGLWNDLPCSWSRPYLVEFSTGIEIFDNITGDSKDLNPPASDPEDPVVDPEEPTVDLADTGFDAGLIAALAILLIAAGAGLRVVARRK
jgi:hypothetical protein